MIASAYRPNFVRVNDGLPADFFSMGLKKRSEIGENIVKRADALAAMAWMQRNVFLLPRTDRAFFFAKMGDRQKALKWLGSAPSRESLAKVELSLGNETLTLELADSAMAEFKAKLGSRDINSLNEDESKALHKLATDVGIFVYRAAMKKHTADIDRFVDFLYERGNYPCLGWAAAATGKADIAQDCRQRLMEFSKERDETEHLEGRSPELFFAAAIDAICKDYASARKQASSISAYNPSLAWIVYSIMKDKQDILEIHEILERISCIPERASIAAYMGDIRESLKCLKQCFSDPKAKAHFVGAPDEIYRVLKSFGLKTPYIEFIREISKKEHLELFLDPDGCSFKVALEKHKVHVNSLSMLDAFEELGSLSKKTISETESAMKATPAELEMVMSDALDCRDTRMLRAVIRLFPEQVKNISEAWLARTD